MRVAPGRGREGGGREGGFTLLEVLVALVVFGFVAAGLSEGLRFGLRTTARQERLAVERGDLDAVDRVLRRLVAQMDPGTNRDPTVVAGDQREMAFTTDLGAAASALSTTVAEVVLRQEGDRLVLRWRPMLHAVRLGPAVPFREAVLLDGLERLELSYWGAVGEEAPGWRGGWRQKGLPALVRVRLVFPAGLGRRWPDIVAGPVRVAPAA